MKKILLPASALSSLLIALPSIAFSPAGEEVTYRIEGETFEGYFVSGGDSTQGSVMIVHDWDGLDDYERQRADMIAEKGYDVFAVDLYGQGNRPQSVEDKRAATNRLYQDRERMRTLTLEIARSGEADNIAAYASFHGGLETPEGQAYSSETAPIFIAHGGADSAVSLEDVATLAKTLEAAEVTYEIGIYSGAPHAFSVFGSDAYHERADQRSWQAFNVWLEEML